MRPTPERVKVRRIKAVERLEQLLDKETTMLIEHQPITFDDFKHKKRHGLLELSHAMDATRGLDRDSRSHDPKPPLAPLRMKEPRDTSDAFGRSRYHCRDHCSRHARA